MSRYGKSKYGIHKYGKYDINIETDLPLSQITRYRLRTIDSLKRYSKAAVNQMVQFTSGAQVKVRMKSDISSWVYQQGEVLEGEKIRIRVRAISKDGSESSWVESVAGTIKTV